MPEDSEVSLPTPTSFAYNAECILKDGSAELLDLEKHGWADKDRLANTVQFSLIPRKGFTHLPNVIIHIPDSAKPVFKSRVFGKVLASGSGGGQAFRCYAIGFKKGSTEYLTWVLPTGDIEVGPDPIMAALILKNV